MAHSEAGLQFAVICSAALAFGIGLTVLAILSPDSYDDNRFP